MPVRRILAKSISLLLLGITWPMLLAQVNTGELRLKVTDPGGSGLSASITISRNSSQYRNSLTTNKSGEVDLKTLPYGIYLLRAESQGFTSTT
jgi:Carboxypeptidase regulatory-like domain